MKINNSYLVNASYNTPTKGNTNMHRFSKVLLAAVVAAAVVMVPRMAVATDITGTFTVAATVSNVCKVTAGNNVDFGAYDPTGTAVLKKTSAINVKCTRGTGYGIALTSAGGWKMKNGTEGISYSVKQPNDSTDWTTTALTGLTAVDNKPYSYVANLSTTEGQDVPAGSYLDTVTVTVTY
jgi:spore coat protein U-like protein